MKKTLAQAFKEAGFVGETSMLKLNKKVHRDVVQFLKRKDADEKRSLKTKMRFGVHETL